VKFGITSLSRAKIMPEHLLKYRCYYWGMETGLHYRRDVPFKEDAWRMTTLAMLAGLWFHEQSL